MSCSSKAVTLLSTKEMLCRLGEEGCDRIREKRETKMRLEIVNVILC